MGNVGGESREVKHMAIENSIAALTKTVEKLGKFSNRITGSEKIKGEPELAPEKVETVSCLTGVLNCTPEKIDNLNKRISENIAAMESNLF